MRVVVDRIEGQSAVIKFPDHTTKDVPLNELPNELKPGDCFLYSNGLYMPFPEGLTMEEYDELIESLWNERWSFGCR